MGESNLMLYPYITLFLSLPSQPRYAAPKKEQIETTSPNAPRMCAFAQDDKLAFFVLSSIRSHLS